MLTSAGSNVGAFVPVTTFVSDKPAVQPPGTWSLDAAQLPAPVEYSGADPAKQLQNDPSSRVPDEEHSAAWTPKKVIERVRRKRTRTLIVRGKEEGP